MTDRSLLARAREDVGTFAEALVGAPLWDHQLDLLRATERTCCVVAGRQVGKSRALGVAALFEAFRGSGRTVLIVSATELASKRLLAEVASLASSPLLAGSVVDESKSSLVLSNGSRVISVPASEKQVRGWTVDLLVIDEACFVDDAVTKAARFTTVATGGRTIMVSTPFGRRDRAFASAFAAGEAGAPGHRAFRWPSRLSPMISDDTLAEWKPTMTAREWRAEIEGEWPDADGAYFDPAELDAATAFGVELLDLADADGLPAVAGVDWGFANDASTCVVVSDVLEASPGVWWVPWVGEWFGKRYGDVIEEVATVAGAFSLGTVTSETNGVGAMPSQSLADRLAGLATVRPVATTAALKENCFGALRMRLQAGQLALPRHPGLLRQLASLEFEQRDSGVMRIAVPERAGHDDLCMGLALAILGDPVFGAQGRPVARRRGLVVRGLDGEVFDPDAIQAGAPGGAAADARARAGRAEYGIPGDVAL